MSLRIAWAVVVVGAAFVLTAITGLILVAPYL